VWEREGAKKKSFSFSRLPVAEVEDEGARIGRQCNSRAPRPALCEARKKKNERGENKTWKEIEKSCAFAVLKNGILHDFTYTVSHFRGERDTCVCVFHVQNVQVHIQDGWKSGSNLVGVHGTNQTEKCIRGRTPASWAGVRVFHVQSILKYTKYTEVSPLPGVRVFHVQVY